MYVVGGASASRASSRRTGCLVVLSWSAGVSPPSLRRKRNRFREISLPLLGGEKSRGIGFAQDKQQTPNVQLHRGFSSQFGPGDRPENPLFDDVVANENITFSELRVVDENGFVGDFDLDSALEIARHENLDLVLLDTACEPALAKLIKLADYFNQREREHVERARRCADAGVFVDSEIGGEQQESGGSADGGEHSHGGPARWREDRGGAEWKLPDSESVYHFDPALKVKGMRVSCVADPPDLARKLDGIRHFLKKGHRVQVALSYAPTADLRYRDPNQTSIISGRRFILAGREDDEGMDGNTGRPYKVTYYEDGTDSAGSAATFSSNSFHESLRAKLGIARLARRGFSGKTAMVALARRIVGHVRGVARLGPDLKSTIGPQVEKATVFVNLWPTRRGAGLLSEEETEELLERNLVWADGRATVRWRERKREKEELRLGKRLGLAPIRHMGKVRVEEEGGFRDEREIEG